MGDNEGQGWVAWQGGGSRQPPMMGAGAGVGARTAEVLTIEVRGRGRRQGWRN